MVTNVMSAKAPFVASSQLCSALCAVGSAEKVSQGTVLFRQGEEVKGIYVVNSGRVRLSLMDASTGSVSDRFAESGSVLGLPATMAGNAYSLTAEVRSAAEVVFVRRERVLELLRQQTTLCFEVVEILAQEVAHMRRDAATAFSAVN
jgi:CRP-like cAMP-binding protein